MAQAKKLKGISHTILPKFLEFFLGLAKKGVPSAWILTPPWGVFNIVREKYHGLLKDWLLLEGSELYVSRHDIKFSFAVTDSNFSPLIIFV